MKQKTTIFFVILISAAIFISLFALGHWSLMDFDEATYARVIHESLVNKNFLSFTLGGAPWFEKPPLYFWFAGASAAILGENEFAMRLPSALLLVGSIILVWFIVFELTKNKRSAFLSSAVLLSTAFFLFAGRQVRLDVPVTFSILFTLYSFIRGLKSPRWFWGVGVGLASGILFKSVIGLLVLPLFLIFSLIYREWGWIKNKIFWASIVFSFLLLILPWHLYESIKFGGQFWNIYFSTHVLERITGNIVFGETASRFYHLGQLFVATQPWFLIFTLLAVWFIVQNRSKIIQHKFELFSLAATLFVLLVFHFPRTILLYYFIPMLPFMAMFIGSSLNKLTQSNSRFIITISLIIFILGFTAAGFRIFSNKDRGFFLEPLPKISRYMLAEEEKIVGEKIAHSEIPFYVYKWKFFPSIIYYSDAAKILIAANGGRVNPPFFLLVPRPLFKNTELLPFRSEEGQLTWNLIYSGQAAMLFRAEATPIN